MSTENVVDLDKKKPLDEFAAMAECVRIINRVKGPDAQDRIALYILSRYELPSD